MKLYGYPPKALIGDYLRAAIGAALGATVLLSAELNLPVVLIFGGLTALFAVFGLRTLQRQLTRVAVTEQEICDRGLGTRVMSWADLDHLKLRFYGTRRQRTSEGGFMQLTFKGAGTGFKFESSLEGFEDIAWRAAQAARANGVALDPTSSGNLAAMGIAAEGARPEPEV